MNNTKVIKVKKLLLKNKFEEIIILVENTFSDVEKTPEILNILGVSKLQKKNSNDFDLLSAIENFRDCYLKEKNTNQGIEGLLNFIVSFIPFFKLVLFFQPNSLRFLTETSFCF